MPGTSVYFVCPLRIACTAASLMRWGVSKSGSPAPNEITSMPLRFSSLALAWTASVAEGASVARRLASMERLLLPELVSQALLDAGRNHARHGRAEARHLPDQPRRDVRVALMRHEEDGLDGRPELPVYERHLEFVLEVGD